MTTFEFESTWHTTAAPERVTAVLEDLQRYPEWWPQVLAVAKVDDDTARVLCRSALPYTLDLVLHAVRREAACLEVAISGDLEGTSSFVLSPVAGTGGTRVDYRQRVVVARRGLDWVSAALRPLARWNHERMMCGCRDGLQERAATAAS